MVEFALIALPFFMLICGIIDFSIVIFDMHAVNAGSRASARAISTGQIGTDSSCNLAMNPADVTALTGQGMKLENLERVICLTKFRSKLAADRIRVEVHFEDNIDPNLVVNPSSQTLVPGNSVVVCTMTQINSITKFYSAVLDNRFFRSKTRSRLEAGQEIDFPNLAAGGELAFPGSGGWAPCYAQLALPTGWKNTAN
jgi:Flp pilus assembly protein TadG